MNQLHVPTLTDVLRPCSSKSAPAKAFVATRVVLMHLLLGFVGLLSGGASAAAQTVGCVPNTANYPCVYVSNLSEGTVSAINAVTNNVIAKFDYRYMSFNGYNRPGSVANGGLTVNGQLPYSTVSTYSVVSLGLDFKFGGPVVAKY